MSKEKIKVNDHVILTAQATSILGYKADAEGVVIDVLYQSGDIENFHPYVVNFPDMGKDHRQFFNEDELIRM